MLKMIRNCLVLLSVLLLFIPYQTADAQQITVNGVVTDQSKGEPLPSVNVKIKGLLRGTTTNNNGKYEIVAPSPNDTLIFSYIGYETRVIPIRGRRNIDVVMKTRTLSGQEMVVVGYGTQQRGDLTGSISSVDPEEFTQVTTQSLTEALQGKVAGVRITPTSGRPGAEPDIKIRGVGTLNNASPLYVVDGMLTDDISFLDPQNVQSVEVLKDASATAIYGSRGANGVVVITTKDGRAGKPQVTAHATYGLQRVNNKIDMVNAHNYAMLANESAKNEGRPKVFENPDKYEKGTNWQDLLIDDNAPVKKYNITANGGSDQMTYNISASFYDEKGVYRNANFRRVNFRVNNKYFLSDQITIGNNLAFVHNDRKVEPNDIVNRALRADPTVPPRNEKGEFQNTTIHGGSGNPVAALAYNKNDNFLYRLNGTAYLEVDFLQNFTFRSDLGVDWSRDERKQFDPEYFVSPIQSNERSQLTVTEERQVNWLNENTLKYKNNFGPHSVDLLTGVTFQENVFESLGGSRVNFPGSKPIFWFLNAGEADGQSNFNASNSWGMISYLFRVNYVYDNRYLFTGTFRRDGSSKFASQNQWGNFPSLALGWRISNEPFMKDISAISNLKLRASWGIIGNEKIPSGEAIPTVNSGFVTVFGPNQSLNPAATVTALSNPELKWEETEQYDVGLEIGLFKDRLRAEFDWYRKVTSDILVRVPIPDIVGVTTPPIVNAAKVLNSGLEFRVNWSEQIGDFDYQIGINGSTVHNEVLSLGQRDKAILGGSVRQLSFTTRTAEGHPIGAFYGWDQIGIFQTKEEIANSPTRGMEKPGDIKIADKNGDGKITQEDKTYLGSPIPDFTFGFNFSANYRNFDLSLSLDGQLGGQVVYARQAIRGFRLLNYESLYLDRWTGPGTSHEEPRITESGHNYQVLDRFIYSSDYLRLRNVELGYTLPLDVTTNIGIRNVRIFASATNVLRFDSYVGYTPQIGGGSVIATGIDRGTYPVPSSYTLGIDIKF